MSLLKSEPAGAVKSLDELFAIAYAMEQEAATRYDEISHRLRAEGNVSLAQVFERLADEERGHLDSVIRWSEREKGTPPDPALVRWQTSDAFDDEGAGAADAHLLTAYRSLSMAVRNEERAFAFWTYVAGQAEHSDIRRAAESLAREELEHVATLRRERRLAYHAERHLATPGGIDAAEETAALERRLAERLENRAGTAAPAQAARLREFAREAIANSEELAREPLPIAGSLTPSVNQLEEAATIAELLVERYLISAERLNDEVALTRLQALAGRAINRLAWLRADLPEIERR